MLIERNIGLTLLSLCFVLSLLSCTHSELDYVRELCHTDSMVGELQGSKAVLEAKRADLESVKASLEVERYKKLSQQLEGYQADWESLNRDTQLACKDWAICQYRSRQDRNQSCTDSRRAMEERQKQARSFFERIRTHKVEKDVTEIQERIKPRRITDAQRARLTQALKKSPKGQVQIASPIGDSEAQLFARQIREIFESSGWTGIKFTYNIFKGTPVGLSLNVRDGNKVPLFAEMLLQAFESSDIPVIGAYMPELPDETVEILVGMKPE